MADSSQLEKALALGSYFLSGALAINVAQVVGAPLSLINHEWYQSWIAFTKQQFAVLTMAMTQRWAPTVVRVSGDKSVRGQLFQTAEGDLYCNFPKRLVLIANHQIYTDWLYLWWIAYCNRMHGRVYIVLKESLKNIPVIGWGMQLCQFIFLKRNWESDKPQMAAHLKKLNNVNDPMWLLLFPEGTNLADSTREASAKWAAKNGIKDLQHLLLPRTTGLQFCLQELRHSIAYMYDCTIAYEDVARGQFAQDIYTIQSTFVGGKPPKCVHMYWRRFKITDIPLDDTRLFELWLRARWMEKDSLLEYFMKNKQFPADTGASMGPGGKDIRRGCGYINSPIKANRWYEFLQAFMPMGVFAMVLSTFYGALPQAILNVLNKQGLMKDLSKYPQLQVTAPEKRITIDPATNRVKTAVDPSAAKAAQVNRYKILQPAARAKSQPSKTQNNINGMQKQVIKQTQPKPATATTNRKITTIPASQTLAATKPIAGAKVPQTPKTTSTKPAAAAPKLANQNVTTKAQSVASAPLSGMPKLKKAASTTKAVPPQPQRQYAASDIGAAPNKRELLSTSRAAAIKRSNATLQSQSQSQAAPKLNRTKGNKAADAKSTAGSIRKLNTTAGVQSKSTPITNKAASAPKKLPPSKAAVAAAGK